MRGKLTPDPTMRREISDGGQADDQQGILTSRVPAFPEDTLAMATITNLPRRAITITGHSNNNKPSADLSPKPATINLHGSPRVVEGGSGGVWSAASPGSGSTFSKGEFSSFAHTQVQNDERDSIDVIGKGGNGSSREDAHHIQNHGNHHRSPEHDHSATSVWQRLVQPFGYDYPISGSTQPYSAVTRPPIMSRDRQSVAASVNFPPHLLDAPAQDGVDERPSTATTAFSEPRGSQVNVSSGPGWIHRHSRASDATTRVSVARGSQFPPLLQSSISLHQCQPLHSSPTSPVSSRTALRALIFDALFAICVSRTTSVFRLEGVAGVAEFSWRAIARFIVLFCAMWTSWAQIVDERKRFDGGKDEEDSPGGGRLDVGNRVILADGGEGQILDVATTNHEHNGNQGGDVLRTQMATAATLAKKAAASITLTSIMDVLETVFVGLRMVLLITLAWTAPLVYSVFSSTATVFVIVLLILRIIYAARCVVLAVFLVLRLRSLDNAASADRSKTNALMDDWYERRRRDFKRRITSVLVPAVLTLLGCFPWLASILLVRERSSRDTLWYAAIGVENLLPLALPAFRLMGSRVGSWKRNKVHSKEREEEPNLDYDNLDWDVVVKVDDPESRRGTIQRLPSAANETSTKTLQVSAARAQLSQPSMSTTANNNFGLESRFSTLTTLIISTSAFFIFEESFVPNDATGLPTRFDIFKMLLACTAFIGLWLFERVLAMRTWERDPPEIGAIEFKSSTSAVAGNTSENKNSDGSAGQCKSGTRSLVGHLLRFFHIPLHAALVLLIFSIASSLNDYYFSRSVWSSVGAVNNNTSSVSNVAGATIGIVPPSDPMPFWGDKGVQVLVNMPTATATLLPGPTQVAASVLPASTQAGTSNGEVRPRQLQPYFASLTNFTAVTGATSTLVSNTQTWNSDTMMLWLGVLCIFCSTVLLVIEFCSLNPNFAFSLSDPLSSTSDDAQKHDTRDHDDITRNAPANTDSASRTPSPHRPGHPQHTTSGSLLASPLKRISALTRRDVTLPLRTMHLFANVILRLLFMGGLTVVALTLSAPELFPTSSIWSMVFDSRNRPPWLALVVVSSAFTALFLLEFVVGAWISVVGAMRLKKRN
ncbi:hypothetical protein HK102_003455 [Quaeritorhiza haematococci]|nr:hypothetical protein HK102_003455 [Quaeritorhiza haematococci]